MTASNLTSFGKSACALGILLSAAPALAEAQYKIYGKAEIQLAHTYKGLMRYTKEGTQIDAPFSRLGIDGSNTLSGDLKLIYKYEVQVKGFESDDTDSPFAARNTYIGLRGSFGTLVAGRNDTRFKFSEGKLDLFNETQGDIAQVLAGQDRLGDTLTYTTPTWQDFNVSLTYAPKDDANNQQAGFAVTAIYGDRALKSKPYYVALSHTDSLNNLIATRVVAVTQWQQWQFGALLQDSENLSGDKFGKGYVASVSYTHNQWRPKLQFASDDSRLRHSGKAEQWTLGLDYLYDKQTNLYIMLSTLDLPQDSDSSVALGLKYLF
ncbi:porin [Pseudoalteromonas fenneropenaei]|uniref:Porin n=1 Tax=Pseudoalteromonas fenneropenaei TaxID=1737459 RepID=A0ABV7CQ31_9GAMM